ncbi:MAG: BamA/TamA family outer membrane protein [Arenimonas sp.]|uniref:BamA/TamA family outer membrane protein n=1 Tax=Arenimonas sp. TaxID=1872635 RepID=UPI0025C0C559|nr:BamA/TamA family outer membrane protein [Arenimonas sp.]MBW8366370.1 BamA/TamA family outer membrane protein [Arenimonas sp.]
MAESLLWCCFPSQRRSSSRAGLLTCVLLAGMGLAALPAPVLAAAVQPAAERAAGVPDDATLEAAGAVIGSITIVRSNVFDTALDEEDKAPYRIANRLHVLTRESVIRKQLLFAPGDRYSHRLLEETARLLRAQTYLREAELRPVRYADGAVDIRVETRDVWTLNPGISGGRKGGSNSFGLELEENNLLGTGASLALSRRTDSDRNETLLRYANEHLFRPWIGLTAEINQNSDGNGGALGVQKTFHALDTRRAWGLSGEQLSLTQGLYARGDKLSEFRQKNQDFNAWWGWSRGLREGHVSRYSVGVRRLERQFQPSLDPLLVGPLPEDRNLVGPWISIESIRDDWALLRNYDQIGITEDELLGRRYLVRVGRSDTGLGADRDAWWLEAEASRGYRLQERSQLRLSSALSGRWEDGDSRDLRLTGSARFYRETGRHRLFFATLDGQYGHNLDLDNPTYLGGENGLRGYPQRWAAGESFARLSVEQRYYTDWFPWRLFRVGGAIFADVGRTWGRNGLGTENPGTLADIGVGLRLSNSRSAFARVIHVDLAIPLDSDPSLKNVELLVEARREF